MPPKKKKLLPPPENPRGIYRRREFDPSRHCGHPVDRSVEYHRERRDKTIRRIDELIGFAQSQGRDLTKSEAKELEWRNRILVNIEKHILKREAEGPDERPCMNVKGYRTDHPDVGLCRKHCICKGRDGGHLGYGSRKLQDAELRDLIQDMEASEEDILNLDPDVIVLRAKIKLFLNKKQDFDPETVKSLTLLSEQLRKTIESINDKKFKTMITKDVFDLILFRMAEVLMKHVVDQEILERIQQDWARIAVETGSKARRRLA